VPAHACHTPYCGPGGLGGRGPVNAPDHPLPCAHSVWGEVLRDNVNGTSGRQDPFATVAAPSRGGGIVPVNVPVHFPHAGCFRSPCHGPNSHPTPMPSPTQFAWLPVGGGGAAGVGGGGTTPWTHAMVRSDTSTAAAILISLTFGMRNGAEPIAAGVILLIPLSVPPKPRIGPQKGFC
jgi:hypothetical protein